MIVLYDRSFLKDISKINDKKVLLSIETCILEFKKAENIREISNVKKLKANKTAYRIKIGLYRLGFYLNEDKIELTRFLHRKEIYRFFP
ncbi:MAG: type II toxin-antitoxin system RelE/ParE family toxin [Bacteroidota bacterium]